MQIKTIEISVRRIFLLGVLFLLFGLGTATSFASAGNVVQVEAGSMHGCGLKSDGTVDCWGQYGGGPIPTDTFSQISATGRLYGCGIKTTDSMIVCWGNNTFGVLDVPANSGPFMQVYTGHDTVCGVQTDYKVVCWGEDSRGQTNVPDVLFTDVGVGDARVCAIKKSDGGVMCWGDRVNLIVLGAGPYEQLTSSPNFHCGLKADGTPECFGNPSNPWFQAVATPPAGVKFSYIDAGDQHVCGVTDPDQSIVCWGTNDFGQFDVPAGAGPFIDVATNFHATFPNFTCGVQTDGDVVCWGNNSANEAPQPEIVPDSISAGVVGTPYSADIDVDTNIGQPGWVARILPNTFTIVSGSLPAGLSLDPDTGIISGTPTAEGSATFKVEAHDGFFRSEKEYTISVTTPPATCDVFASGVNVIRGTSRNDRLKGTPGNDIIIGLGGNDTLEGMGGNDCLIGNDGGDRLIGGDGNDILWGGEVNNSVVHDRRDRDRLYGGDGDDEMHGGGDHDHLEGDDGNDLMYGDDGNDGMHGEDGNDEMHGGNGKDRMEGRDGDDRMYGDAGDDTIVGRDGNDYLDGGDDRDRLEGGDGDDEMHGGAGDDRMNGDKGNDQMWGDAGKDSMQGRDGDDVMYGGTENDDMKGGRDNDEMHGGNGNDRMDGDRGDDRMFGDDGDDSLDARDGEDHLEGGNGDDNLKGGKHDDFLDGGADNDRLDGGNRDQDTCNNGESLRSCEMVDVP